MGLDEEWFRAINTGWANPALDPFMVALSVLGGYFVILYVLPIWFSGRKTRAFDYLVALALALALTAVIKFVVERPRPDEVLAGVRIVPVPSLFAEPDSAFPSGHVARIAVLAAILVLILPDWKFALPLAVFILLEALSRIYVGAHWPTDTISGAALGIGIGIAIWRLDRVDRYVRLRTAALRTVGIGAGREVSAGREGRP